MERTIQAITFAGIVVGTVASAIASEPVANGLEIGAKAPTFTAVSADGTEISLDSFNDADILVVAFTCNDCPVATSYEDRFQEFAQQYRDKKVAFVAINNSSREDVEAIKRRVSEKSINYTYAYDGTGKSALDFGAQVTPHCFILDSERKLIYKGAFDDNWNDAPSIAYVPRVVDDLLAGRSPEYTVTTAVGCAIKLRR